MCDVISVVCNVGSEVPSCSRVIARNVSPSLKVNWGQKGRVSQMGINRGLVELQSLKVGADLLLDALADVGLLFVA